MLYASDPLGVDLEQTVYAMDSTTIDLCLSLFPWAHFRTAKAAVKLHTLLDLRGNIPCFVHVSPRKTHDVNVLDRLLIEPGSPWENGYIESFNGKLRDELLEREAFDTLLEAKVLIERWRQHYNTIRPHSALGYRPPAPEAWQPRAFASATPQQTHGAGLLEGKILT